MIVKLLISILIIFIVFWLLKRIKLLSTLNLKGIYIQIIMAVAIVFAVYLAITGRLHWLVVALIPLLTFSKKLFYMVQPFFRFIPLLSRYYHKSRQNKDTPPPHPGNQVLTDQEALSILGLKKGASKHDIIVQHKRLIQKLHPDRGGSDYLAARINQAKDTLIKL